MLDLTVIPATHTTLPPVFEARHLIDGHWRGDGPTSERLSPSHGTVVSRALIGTIQDTEAAIAAARKAFDDGRWSAISGKARATALLKTADLIEANTFGATPTASGSGSTTSWLTSITGSTTGNLEVTYTYTAAPIAPVPEPPSLLLGFGGILGMAGFAFKRRAKNTAAAVA